MRQLPARWTMLLTFVLATLMTQASPAVANADPHGPDVHIVAEDTGCPDGRELCLLVLEGNPRTLRPGEDATVLFENRGNQPHTLHIARLSDAAPDHDTDPHATLSSSGHEPIDPARRETVHVSIPDEAEGLYLWCERDGHEAHGMWIKAPFTQEALEAAQGPLESPAGQAIVAASALAGLAAAWWYRKRLWMLLVGLYTRLTKREVLEHEARAKLLEIIEAQPGIHFRQLARHLEMGHGLLDHHLSKLAEAGFIEAHSTESHRCYFATGKVPDRERAALVSVKAGGAQRVMQALAEEPGRSLTEIADAVGLARSTVSHHVSRLQDVDVVQARREGRSKRLSLTELGEDVLERVQATGDGTGEPGPEAEAPDRP